MKYKLMVSMNMDGSDFIDRKFVSTVQTKWSEIVRWGRKNGYVSFRIDFVSDVTNVESTAAHPSIPFVFEVNRK